MRRAASQPYRRAQVARLIEILAGIEQGVDSFSTELVESPPDLTFDSGCKAFEGVDEACAMLDELGMPTISRRLKAFQLDASIVVFKLAASDCARGDPRFHTFMLKVFGDDFAPGRSEEEHAWLQRDRRMLAGDRLERCKEFVRGLIARLRSVPTAADDNTTVPGGAGAGNEQCGNEYTLAEASEKYDIPRPAWTKAAQLEPGEYGYLPTRAVGRNRFATKADAEKFAKDYEARREQRAVGSKSADPDARNVVASLQKLKKNAPRRRGSN